MIGHPAGVSGRAIWYGPEVEGILAAARPMTAFLSAIPERAEDLNLLLYKIRNLEVRQVFICETFDGWFWFETVLARVIWPDPHNRVSEIVVTIGCFPGDVERLSRRKWFDRVHLAVRVDMEAAWLKHLRTTDQIAVGVPYDLTTWSVKDGVQTAPSDYMDDEA